MANYIRIQIRRDTTTNWSSSNPVLALGEIGCDMTLHRLKVGDGVSNWTSLPYIGVDVVNDLITGGSDVPLSAEQGKVLKTLIDSKSSVTVVDNLTSTSTTTALSANKGRELKTLLDQKANSSEITTLRQEVSNIQNDTTNIRNEVTNIKQEINNLGSSDAGIFGMGYTVDSFNGYGKPTKITFEDGVSATLTWSGTKLDKITASTGEVMTMTYNVNGLITGRTITRG